VYLKKISRDKDEFMQSLMTLLFALTIFPQWGFAKGPAKSEKSVQKICKSIEKRQKKENDRELEDAARACFSSKDVNRLDLVRGLSRLANKDAAGLFLTTSNRLEFVAKHLETLREILINADDWSRPTPQLQISEGLAELSGFAWDSSHNRIFGISDESAQLVRISVSDLTKEFFKVDGLQTVDTEALLFAPDGQVWIMDIGDNKGKRDFVAVHTFDPDKIQNGRVKIEHSFRIRYPNGKRPNVEAAFIHKDHLFLIQKTLYQPAEIFKVAITKEDELQAESAGFLPAGSPISDVSFDASTGRLFALGWFDLREIVGWQEGVVGSARLIFEDFLGQQEALTIDPHTGATFIGAEDGSIYIRR